MSIQVLEMICVVRTAGYLKALSSSSLSRTFSFSWPFPVMVAVVSR